MNKVVDKVHFINYDVHVINKMLCRKNKEPQERRMQMSEKEKKIVEALAEALPSMSEFDKGYVLGIAESNRKKQEEKREDSGKEG